MTLGKEYSEIIRARAMARIVVGIVEISRRSRLWQSWRSKRERVSKNVELRLKRLPG